MEKPILSIKIKPSEGKEEMEPINKAPESVEAPEFDHEAHMAKVEDGLKRILSTNNLQEIKTIAQDLLKEEETEEAIEEQPQGFDFKKAAMEKLSGANA